MGGAARAAPPPPAPTPRLFTLDCGRLDFPDLGDFSDTGEHEGEPVTLAVPCYLVQHGGDWLLWDTGVGDEVAAHREGVRKEGGRFSLKRTLTSQLAELGLRPDDIRYVALSHLHADHSGNIGLFPKATFLIAPAELAWARARPTPGGVEPALIAPLDHARIKPVEEDLDVFGDGAVRMLAAPGHTPGHHILLLRLAKAGSLLISGDLYHTRENYRTGRVPHGNASRADTLASFDRFAGLVRTFHARVIVEHAPEDFTALPAFPRYLD